MPLYDFSCRECGRSFESLVRNDSEVSAQQCPYCEGREVEKLISLPARPVMQSAGSASSGPCGEGPPCGASWCQRK